MKIAMDKITTIELNEKESHALRRALGSMDYSNFLAAGADNEGAEFLCELSEILYEMGKL